MGRKLPEPLNERELDICLMKEAQRVDLNAQLAKVVEIEEIFNNCFIP
ncbi:hypothetical protein [Halotia branconii]|uniref:Uncharacterized protein n=1 Tax=Halotia branconii CENA392 TaxID=1539056 RepID=A0AAJ6NQE9_9CYAN|nr:hypothetical protein [Halotia branconii]WGV24636.1 hypothetical protein QI031_23135 [Halotia branconii CENA392]